MDGCTNNPVTPNTRKSGSALALKSKVGVISTLDSCFFPLDDVLSGRGENEIYSSDTAADFKLSLPLNRKFVSSGDF